MLTGPSRSTRTLTGPGPGRVPWMSGTRLADLPGVRAGQQGGQVALALPGPGRGDLLGHQLVVAGPRRCRNTPIGVCAKSALSSRDKANA